MNQDPGLVGDVTVSQRAVFLSYASQDAAAAERICATLRGAGIEVLFDQSALRGGDAWDVAIRKQIRTCALFIPVISRNTHARDEGYLPLEWKPSIPWVMPGRRIRHRDELITKDARDSAYQSA